MQNDELKNLCAVTGHHALCDIYDTHTVEKPCNCPQGKIATALLQRLEAEEAGYVLVRRVLLENVRDVIMNAQNDIRSPGDDALMPRLVNQINDVLLAASPQVTDKEPK